MKIVLCALLLCSMSIMPAYNNVSQEDIAKLQEQQNRLAQMLKENHELLVKCALRQYRYRYDLQDIELLMYAQFNSGQQK